jgi:hypothetical protein
MAASATDTVTKVERNDSARAPNPRHETLTGWCRYPLYESDIYRPEKNTDIAFRLDDAAVYFAVQIEMRVKHTEN